MKRQAAGLGMLLWLALSGIASWGLAAEPFVLEIPDQVVVAGPKICLADLGQLKGANSEDREFISSLKLGLAPAPGQTRFFSRSYLEFILKQQKGNRCPTLLMGPRVAVSVASVMIDSTAIAAAVEALLAPPEPGVLKQWVQLQNLSKPVCLPKGNWRIEVHPVNERIALGVNMFKVKLISNTETRTINIVGVLHKMALVYRANCDVANKTPLKAETFDQVATELITGREYIGVFPVGYRNLRSIRRGQVLLSETLQRQPLVCKGDEVKVTYCEDGVLIMVTALAKQDGWAGDRIILINPQSRKEYRGRVSGPGTAEVD